MNGGPSGFTNAPVTRAFIIASALFTIFFGIQGRFNSLGLSYQDIFGKLRLWKLIMSVFAFSSTPEMMFGLYLLYYFRVFERQIGSNKYSVFIVFSVLTSLLFEVISLALLRDPAAKLVTPGPYGLIFASYVPFFLDIPVSTRIRVFGIPFSDKSFIYLAGLQQLVLSSWRRSLLPGMCGILAGSLYRLNVFYIRKAKFPDFISSFFSRFSLPSMGSPRGPSTRNVAGNVPSYPTHQMERNYPAPVQYAVEPSEDSITTLVSMGFDRNSARQALVQARNDVNVATNILLEAQSH
ncbi:rhomboid-like protein 20 isoform X1 [Arachis duranensis]|uniref:Rhomboid-like protein 20 isoform X1 n=1 Tax=Arachis duranensis TaxID=130453 RepID=A0A6P4BZ77_ARADU|nr:rhomboid-like protein 20 isoform X1 [Arachis duranensis]XP_016180177.1 rhomboid-like protein 20 isoform X1 [Arachis ipaensis]XP_025624359.1 rhomboid-like protein 20 isoform X1 [Arachis hypogaea]XP_025685917.1 rhomboid-like protein 20 isoform X1 [Arachis hypogaea]XP_057737815.1 rhomboid-like protein 20 isoform X1 [Arachis stenosperma]QHN83873.1 Rhomboid-like protein [Arachis hypogaea]QHO17433.1 Rhomboid-like protein [Arachis hypogaea]